MSPIIHHLEKLAAALVIFLKRTCNLERYINWNSNKFIFYILSLISNYWYCSLVLCLCWKYVNKMKSTSNKTHTQMLQTMVFKYLFRYPLTLIAVQYLLKTYSNLALEPIWKTVFYFKNLPFMKICRITFDVCLPSF